MFHEIFRKLVRSRTLEVVNRITPYLEHSKSIIDIGSGTGDIAYSLKAKGKNITPVDVADFHGPRLIPTTIYNGRKLPFGDKTFDTAMLLMVMHHTSNPAVVFREAARVAKEIVVIETSYSNRINRFLTVISDTMGNIRLDANWDSYKSDTEWKQFFSEHGFKIAATLKYNDKQFGFIPFLHILYYLKRK